MNTPPPDHPAGAGGPSTTDAVPTPGDAPSAVLTGSGELRRNTGPSPAYIGHIVLGGLTIGLEAKVAEDLRGRSFANTARLDPADFTQTELDRLLTAPTLRGAGLGGPRRLTPVGPIRPPAEPFSSIPSSLLANPRFRALSGSAMRLHLLYEAAFHPSKEWYVSSAEASERMAASEHTVGAGRRELERCGFLILKKAGVRHGQAGGQSGKGRAAVYRLPHRVTGVDRKDWGWWGAAIPLQSAIGVFIHKACAT